MKITYMNLYFLRNVFSKKETFTKERNKRNKGKGRYAIKNGSC